MGELRLLQKLECPSSARCPLPAVPAIQAHLIVAASPAWLPPMPLPFSVKVSWCKLEVEVDSHKAVTANPAENKCARWNWLAAAVAAHCTAASRLAKPLLQPAPRAAVAWQSRLLAALHPQPTTWQPAGRRRC